MGIDAKIAHEELITVLGPNAPSYRTVARQTSRFREGREEKMSMMTIDLVVQVFELTDENIELVQQIINNDPNSTYDEIITETSRPHGTIERTIHDCLTMKKTSRWVSH